VLPSAGELEVHDAACQLAGPAAVKAEPVDGDSVWRDCPACRLPFLAIELAAHSAACREATKKVVPAETTSEKNRLTLAPVACCLCSTFASAEPQLLEHLAAEHRIASNAEFLLAACRGWQRPAGSS
jgi:hypothetical protein